MQTSFSAEEYSVAKLKLLVQVYSQGVHAYKLLFGVSK